MPHSDSLSDGIHSLATAVQLPVEIVGLNSPLSNNGLGNRNSTSHTAVLSGSGS